MTAELEVDAVGDGVVDLARLPIAGKPAELLRQVGKFLDERDSPRPMIVAVDCPSGMDCDTGLLDPVAPPADMTVTFAAAKRGQFAFPGAGALGELVVADIGIDPELSELASVDLSLATTDWVRSVLPARPRDAHKGTFGRALVVAGSVNYTGAAYLSSAAADILKEIVIGIKYAIIINARRIDIVLFNAFCLIKTPIPVI
jgi:NAD(P)H-hydrate epimerase